MTEPTAEEQHSEPGGTPGRRARRILAGALTATLVAGSIAGVAWLQRGEEFPRKDPEYSFILSSFSPTNTKFSVGLPIEDKGQDIEILEVTARTTPNVEHLGAYAIWPRDLDPVAQPGVLPDYPTGTRSRHPVEVPVPAVELEFEPEGYGAPGDLFVQAGYRLTSGDIGGLLGLKLRYKVGGKTKSEYFSWGVIVCVEPHRCGGAGRSDKRPDEGDFYERAYVQLGLVPADEYKR